MPWESGNYSNISGVMNRVATQLQNTGFMGAGNAWTLEQYYDDGQGHFPYTGIEHRYGNGEAWIFKVPGPTNTGDYYMGMTSNLYDGQSSNTANVLFGMRKDAPSSSGWLTGTLTYKGVYSGAGYDYALGDVVSDSTSPSQSYRLYSCISPYTSTATNPSSNSTNWRLHTSFYHKDLLETPYSGQITTHYGKSVREDDQLGITYWLIANTQRIILILKCPNSRWFVTYNGGYNAVLPINKNPYQYIVGYNGDLASLSYTDPGLYNFPNAAYSTELTNKTYQLMDRTGTYYTDTSSSTMIKLHNFSRRDNGKYILSPVYVLFYSFINDEENDFYGSLDGVFLLDNDELISGDIILIDSVQYICIENVFRLSSDRFCAIRLDGFEGGAGGAAPETFDNLSVGEFDAASIAELDALDIN